MRLHVVDMHRGVPEKEHAVGRRAGNPKAVWVENQEERSMSSFSLQRNAESQSYEQNYGDDPLADCATDLYTLNMFPLRKSYVRRLIREAGFELVRTYGDFQERYQENEAEFLIHVAENSVTSNRQLRDRLSPASRRQRHLEKLVPLAVDAAVPACLDPARPCTTDDSVKRNGH